MLHIFVDHEQRRKMDTKSEVGIFLSYSINSRAYRVYNTHTKTIMESINVIIGDNPCEKEVVEDEDVSPQQIEVPLDVSNKGV